MKLHHHVCPKNHSEKYLHWCPGCRELHSIQIQPPLGSTGPSWTFNGSMDLPTFMPSVNHVGRCHYFITDGNIRFMPDSRHVLKGETVPLPDIPDGELDW